jgi:hypothetical protein
MNEMCRRHGKMHTDFSGEPVEKKTFDIRDPRGKIILKWVCEPDSSD